MGYYSKVGLVVNKAFKKHLWLTNTICCGSFFALGDCIQQGIERFKKKEDFKYDWKRTRKFFIVGLFQGPPHHFFYLWLDKYLPQKNPKIIMKKILLDQVIAAPLFAITFFMTTGYIEGKTVKEFWEEFSKKFLRIYIFDWCLWPPTQAINFYFVPAAYRVLYISGITIIWDVFLSYTKHYDQKKKEVDEEKQL